MRRMLFVLAILGTTIVMCGGTAHAHRYHRGYPAHPRHHVSYGHHHAHPRGYVSYWGHHAYPRRHVGYPSYHTGHRGHYRYGGYCGW